MPKLVNDLFAAEKFDYVYHLAAYAAEGLSHFIKRFNYTNNVVGSINLINAAVNTRRQVLRLHVVDCRVWRRSAADDRGTAP